MRKYALPESCGSAFYGTKEHSLCETGAAPNIISAYFGIKIFGESKFVNPSITFGTEITCKIHKTLNNTPISFGKVV